MSNKPNEDLSRVHSIKLSAREGHCLSCLAAYGGRASEYHEVIRAELRVMASLVRKGMCVRESIQETPDLRAWQITDAGRERVKSIY